MNIKSVLLAGAAVLAPAVAFAADLPSTKSAPVQYVRICDVYGRGFFYIPGTQTCLKVGGLVRFEVSAMGLNNAYNAVASPNNPGWNGAGTTYDPRLAPVGQGTALYTNKNGIDSIGWESRGRLDMDARTQTAWGTVQTVMSLRLTSASGAYNTNYARIGGQAPSFVGANSVGVTVTAAYIRFAGFTFGRARENFVFDSFDNYINVRRNGFANGVKQLAYTATFGSGFSATLALEAKDDFNAATSAAALGANRAGEFGLAVPTIQTAAVRSTANGPQRLPAVVANIQVDQSWGSAKLMVGAVQNTANLAAPTNGAILNVANGNGPLISKWGYAIGAGAKFKLPMISAGDELIVVASYGKGAMDWVSGFSTSAYQSYLGHYLNGLNRLDVNMTLAGFGPAAPNNSSNGNSVTAELTTAWAVAASFKHMWTPTIASFVTAGYMSITPGTLSRNTDWQLGGLGRSTTYSLSKAVVWTPIQGFELGLDVGYHKLNQRVAANPGALPSGVLVAAACPGNVAGCSPFAANFKVNPSVWTVTARAERRF